MPSDLPVPLPGGGALQIAAAVQDGVLAEFLLDAQHGLLKPALPLQLAFLLLNLPLPRLNAVEEVELGRRFRLLPGLVLAHQPVGGDGESADGQLGVDLGVVNAEDGIRDAPGGGGFPGEVGRPVGVLGDLPAVAVRHGLTVIAAAGRVLDVIAHRQRELVSDQALFQEVQGDGLRHLPNDPSGLLVIIGALQNLAGADTVGLRPVRLDVLHPAGLPAPGVVDEELGVDAEHPVEQLLAVVFAGFPEGAAGDVAHGVEAGGFQLPGVALAHPPEVRQGAVIPELFSVTHFIQLGNTDAVLVRRNVLRHDVHGHLAEIEICTDARRGGDAGGSQDIQDHGLRQLTGGHPVGWEVAGDVHHHLVDGVDMDVLRGDVFQVDVVDLGADLDVPRHPGRGHQVVHRQGRIGLQLSGVGAFAHQLPAGGAEPPLGVDLLDPLDHLEEAGPARDAVGFQRGGDGEADGLLRAAEIRHH